MIKIITIKKEAKRYTISIKADDDTYIFKISEDLLIESRFFSARELTPVEYKEFLNKIPEDSLLIEGIKYLDKRAHSEKELRDHLRDYTSSLTLIDKIVIKLKAKKLLDDEYYKNTILDIYIYDRRDGYNLIVEKLKSLGLDTNFTYPKEALIDNIKYLTIKFNQKTKNEPFKMKVQKCQIYLLRKGYRDTEISRYFNESLIKAENEEELKQKEIDHLKEKYDGDEIKIKEALIKKGFII